MCLSFLFFFVRTTFFRNTTSIYIMCTEVKKTMYIFLLFAWSVINAALAAEPYTVLRSSSNITIECVRYYQKQSGICKEAATYSWDGSSNTYPFDVVKKMYVENGLSGLRQGCEYACGDVHDCRAYSVSNAQTLLTGNVHCAIYTTCTDVLANNYDVFLRDAPYSCLIKATSRDGVFKNYNDNSLPWTQLNRKLVMETSPFQDVHFTVNGVPHEKEEAYRPLKPMDVHCEEEDELDCLFLYSGFLSVGMFVLFVGIVSTNVLLVATKRNLF